MPIVTEQPPVDPDIDFPKSKHFTEIYHNNNQFFVVFTTVLKQPVKCQSCKVEFQSKGKAVCVPYDIAIAHNERYCYPKKDGQGRLIGMEPTWKKEARRFYCIKKECLLERHPYFWKGLLKVESDTMRMLKEMHVNFLKEVVHFTV